MKCGVITHSRQQKQQWGGGWGGGEVGYNFKKQGRQNGGGRGVRNPLPTMAIINEQLEPNRLNTF